MELPPVSDDLMRDLGSKAKSYTLFFLKGTAKFNEPGADRIVWEHGRRNHALRLNGVLSIVCPITDGGAWKGIGIFNATPDEVSTIMEADPGVKAGIFTYEVHPVRGFPGDRLP